MNDTKSLKFSEFQDAIKVILHVADMLPISPRLSAEAVKDDSTQRHLWTDNRSTLNVLMMWKIQPVSVK